MTMMSLTALVALLVATTHAFQAPRPLPSRTNTQRAAFQIDSQVFAAVDDFWQTSPYTAAALVCGVKASAADLVAQRNAFVEEEETDLKRNAAFLLYGALYQGVALEYSFNHLYPAWFGMETTLTVVATKVLFNLLIQSTILTLPLGYLLKSLFANESLESAALNYWNDICHQGLLMKFYAIWAPVFSVAFGVIPDHYRVTFVAVFSFFWLILFSSISYSNDDDAAAVEA